MDIPGEQPYFVANLEIDILVFSVVVPGMLVLHGFEEFYEVFMEVPKTFG